MMDWPAKCAVVIPCLNENSTIGPLVQNIIKHVKTVFVIDDGSTDDTAESARRAGAEVLRHQTTCGKGAALRTGWEHAKRCGFAWALTMDGDGQHCAEDIPAFFECVERTAAALVVGNRMGNAPRVPWLRRLVNRWMSRRISCMTRRELPDSQCGFRLMDLNALATVSLSTTHFEIESEVLLGFIRHSYRVQFVPIRVIYKTEQSKIQPVRDAWRWFQWWWRAKRSLPE